MTDTTQWTAPDPTRRVPDVGEIPTPDQAPAEPTASPFGLIALLGVLAVVAVRWPFIALAIVAFVLMIVLHELGHYVTARRAGMKVTEFFLGFGPRIWSFRRGETEYGIKAIPAGAYVRIVGMNNLDETDPADEPRAYRNKSYPRRLMVAFAGSAMHFLIALVCLFVFLVGFGNPDPKNWRVHDVTGIENVGQPAKDAGIEPGDRIVAIDGVAVPTFTDLREQVQPYPGKTVTVTVERGGQRLDKQVTLARRSVIDGTTAKVVGFLGVLPETLSKRESLGSAFTGTFTEFGSLTTQSVKGLGSLLSPSRLGDLVAQVFNGGDRQQTDPVTGNQITTDENADRPISVIGAVRLTGDAAKTDLALLLRMLAALNIFIGLFNLVPLPPLDGGLVAIATYERIRSRRGHAPYRVDVRKLMPVTYGVVLLLIVIGLSTMYLDIINPIRLP